MLEGQGENSLWPRIHQVNGDYIGSRKLLIVVSFICCNGGKVQVLSWVCQTWLRKLSLTFQVTTSVAEGSFRTMKGLLTSDCPNMDPNTPIGDLLAMVKGDVNNHIREWAK